MSVDRMNHEVRADRDAGRADDGRAQPAAGLDLRAFAERSQERSRHRTAGMRTPDGSMNFRSAAAGVAPMRLLQENAELVDRLGALGPALTNLAHDLASARRQNAALRRENRRLQAQLGAKEAVRSDRRRPYRDEAS